MKLKSIRRRCKQFFQCIFAFLVFAFSGLTVMAELGDHNIPAETQIQPPTRFLWTRNNLETRGYSEEQVASAVSYGWAFYSSYQAALESLRQATCMENGGAWLCHDIEEFTYYPGYDGWIWGYRFCRPYELHYCGWQASSRIGICPGDLIGYRIKDVNDVDRYGYIACPVPSYPDGEKDLAKPEECGERTPHPVHIALGRKELTIPVYSTGDGVFPIEFQLFYQHNDRKRLGAPWRHSYYKSIVVDGQDVPSSARVYRGRGALLFNKDQTTGEWQGDSDINDTLTELIDENDQRTGWLYVDRFNDRIEHYDAFGKLISVEDRSGLTHTLSYNAHGNLVSVTDSFGRQLRFTMIFRAISLT